MDLQEAEDSVSSLSKSRKYEDKSIVEESRSPCDKRVYKDESGKQITKNAWKRLQKKQQMDATRHERRANERMRRKARIREAKDQGLELPPSKKSLKRNRMETSSCHVHVAVDCSFDDYMSYKDIQHLTRQLARSYALNRRAVNPLQFHIVAGGEKTYTMLDTKNNSRSWDVKIHKASLKEAAMDRRIVYLSSESPNVLERLDPEVMYVIGGLVDHNHQKGLCHRLAEENGYEHAQLPISDYIQLKSRKVLSVDQVFGILLYWTETKDWQEAFLRMLPDRKGALPKPDEQTKVQSTTLKVDTSQPDIPAAQCQVDELQEHISLAESAEDVLQRKPSGVTVELNISQSDSSPIENVPQTEGAETIPKDSFLTPAVDTSSVMTPNEYQTRADTSYHSASVEVKTAESPSCN